MQVGNCTKTTLFGAALYADKETSSSDVGKYMVQGVKDGFDKKVINGDAESRSEYFTYIFGSVGLGVLGDKGISKAGKIGKNDHLGPLKPNITIPSPAPTAVGVGPIPYNVMDDHSNQIQQATKERFGDVGKSGKRVGKSSKNTTTVWDIKTTADKTLKYKFNGDTVTAYRDPKTGLSWAKDTTGHGNSTFKVFKEAKGGKELHWVADVTF